MNARKDGQITWNDLFRGDQIEGPIVWLAPTVDTTQLEAAKNFAAPFITYASHFE